MGAPPPGFSEAHKKDRKSQAGKKKDPFGGIDFGKDDEPLGGGVQSKDSFSPADRTPKSGKTFGGKNRATVDQSLAPSAMSHVSSERAAGGAYAPDPNDTPEE